MVTSATNTSLFTLKEACDLLRCHPNTLRKWDETGLLRAVRFGPRGDRRYKKEDVLGLLNKSRYVTDRQETAKVSEVRKTYFREYASLLAKWGRLHEGSVFVDVPCGTGEMTKTLTENGLGKKFYLIDINTDMVEAARVNVPRNGTFIVGDAGDIDKLVHEKVDTIFCSNGFHIYIDRKQEFLKGCYEILKPGGVLIFDVSTRGMNDEISKEFLSVETRELKRLAKKASAPFKFPVWPDEHLLKEYRDMSIKNGFEVNETISIDKWESVDKAIGTTLKIPGRLRPWLPGISDEQRIKIYKEATQIAKKETNIKTITHNRVFLVAEKRTKQHGKTKE